MLYTTYFAQLKYLPENIYPVSICGKAPSWYKGKQYRVLAPSYDIFVEWRETHDNDRYTERFESEVLDGLHPIIVLNELHTKLPYRVRSRMACPFYESDVQHIALLCYERPQDFCHRHLVAQWFRDHGIECKEWIKPLESGM